MRMSHASLASWVVTFLVFCTSALASYGDYDGDGDVDADDFFAFGGCMTGPDGAIGPGCSAFDDPAHNDDGKVDLADMWALQGVAGAAGCGAFKRYYAMVSKSGPATGCIATISTLTPHLCGEPNAVDYTKSNAFVNIARVPFPFNTNPATWMWAQTGYQSLRNQGSTTVVRQVYCETKYLGPLQQGVNPDKQVHPGGWPGVGLHTYGCSMPAQNQGTWNFTLDLDPDDGVDPVPWTSFNHVSWQGVTGTKYGWQAEIGHRTTDVVGLPQNKCKFKGCAYQLNWNQNWVLANIVQQDLKPSDKKLWGMELGSVPNEFRVWDIYPGQ